MGVMLVLFYDLNTIDPCKLRGCKSILYRIMGNKRYQCLSCGHIYSNPSRRILEIGIVKEKTINFIECIQC